MKAVPYLITVSIFEFLLVTSLSHFRKLEFCFILPCCIRLYAPKVKYKVVIILQIF